MATSQKKTRISGQAQGLDVITCVIDIAAGIDQTTAYVFSRAFAAAPMPIAAIRTDANANDAAQGSVSVLSLTKTGFTLSQKGTSTVIQTYNVTFVGDYNNPTAY